MLRPRTGEGNKGKKKHRTGTRLLEGLCNGPREHTVDKKSRNEQCVQEKPKYQSKNEYESIWLHMGGSATASWCGT